MLKQIAIALVLASLFAAPSFAQSSYTQYPSSYDQPRSVWDRAESYLDDQIERAKDAWRETFLPEGEGSFSARAFDYLDDSASWTPGWDAMLDRVDTVGDMMRQYYDEITTDMAQSIERFPVSRSPQSYVPPSYSPPSQGSAGFASPSGSVGPSNFNVGGGYSGYTGPGAGIR